MDPMATTDVHRTTIDIEIGAFERARQLLGTRGYRDTVNGALREVERIERLRRAAETVRGGGLDIVSPDELAELRGPRHDSP